MAFVTITGLSGAAVMAWLSAQLSWFWGTFQWFGVVGVGLVVWLLIGIGLSLYRNSLLYVRRRLSGQSDQISPALARDRKESIKGAPAELAANMVLATSRAKVVFPKVNACMIDARITFRARAAEVDVLVEFSSGHNAPPARRQRHVLRRIPHASGGEAITVELANCGRAGEKPHWEWAGVKNRWGSRERIGSPLTECQLILQFNDSHEERYPFLLTLENGNFIRVASISMFDYAAEWNAPPGL
jgi:hypothetical protein